MALREFVLHFTVKRAVFRNKHILLEMCFDITGLKILLVDDFYSYPITKAITMS